ncbi:hypothetical protein L596_023836 [Steinernema carpocapsae]|uniref:Uncharacterized protein n=1 Tax=Steinernema carpocapsae TaxID=34508 RepID=A0A4U5MEX0_STECR|nr:hypothetical protein L596_023836 [Steinernema carpocapsae]
MSHRILRRISETAAGKNKPEKVIDDARLSSHNCFSGSNQFEAEEGVLCSRELHFPFPALKGCMALIVWIGSEEEISSRKVFTKVERFAFLTKGDAETYFSLRLLSSGEIRPNRS